MTPAKRRSLTVYLVWSLWLAVPYFGFGPASYVRIHDEGDSDVPNHLAIADATVHGDFGYWNPRSLSGVDRSTSFGYGFRLQTALFAFMPGWLAYGLFKWIQRFAAGYFMFSLLNESVGLSLLPSLYAGFAYSLHSI